MVRGHHHQRTQFTPQTRPTDLGPSSTSNLPTYELEGEKAGEMGPIFCGETLQMQKTKDGLDPLV